MSLPRFRVRTLMIVVAVVATPFALRARQQRLEQIAYEHGCRSVWLWNGPLEMRPSPEKENLIRAEGAWHQRMYEKYRHAARYYPFLPVLPDPPRPVVPRDDPWKPAAPVPPAHPPW